MSSGLADPRPGPRLALADFKNAFQRFQKDQMSDHAAALTYYSLLSLFPALLFGVAALGFFGGQSLINDAADYLLKAGAPRETVDAVTSALESAQSQRSTAATALFVAIATSLYGASRAFDHGSPGRSRSWVATYLASSPSGARSKARLSDRASTASAASVASRSGTSIVRRIQSRSSAHGTTQGPNSRPSTRAS